MGTALLTGVAKSGMHVPVLPELPEETGESCPDCMLGWEEESERPVKGKDAPWRKVFWGYQPLRVCVPLTPSLSSARTAPRAWIHQAD